MDPVIQFDKLTKRFGTQVALQDVSFEVPQGVVFALLGENGAGKTTAIRILLGLLEASSGDARALGLNSASNGLQIRRRVGYVAERPTLYEWMTVSEIGWFTAGFYGDGFLHRYSTLASQFGLPERRKLKALSKGMRAKASLALALANDPELLVLDEPTSGLDTLVRREFLESMVDRAALGKTVFLSSHQINEVERVADIVAILREGRLMLVERLDSLKADTRQLTLTLEDGAAEPPQFPGQVLSCRRRSRQWRLLVRGVPEHCVSALHDDPSIKAVDVHVPNLEEIFVAYMRGDPQAVETQLPEEAPA